MHSGSPFFDADQFSVRGLVAAKGTTRVSVCLPARNEAATISSIVSCIHRELVEQGGLVDELIVIDDSSSDATAELAASAGATVYEASSVLPGRRAGPGKGEALWRSLHVSTGDVVIWCDSDIAAFDTRFITGVLGPLVTEDGIDFVKGFYERPDDGVGGGRVTELVARPLLALFFPELSGFIQPLSGEYGGRRSLLEQLAFATGYGVDLGLLIDVTRRCGPSAVAQVDLGHRPHRHRTLEQLGPQALAVMQVALDRAGVAVPHAAALRRPGLVVQESVFSQCPPLVSVGEYRRRSA